jgi:hypothetical protein
MPAWKARSTEFRKMWGYSVGFYGVWVAHVGRRARLFEAIAKRPVTAADLAAQTGLDKRAVEGWCSSAVALGLLNQKGNKVQLPTRIREILLDKKSANYLGGQFSYLALRSLEYGALDGLLRTGATREMTSAFEAITEATDWDHNAFLSAIKRGRNLY